MPTRVSLWRAGATSGTMAALPETMLELLALATKKLQLAAPARRVRLANGVNVDEDALSLLQLFLPRTYVCGNHNLRSVLPASQRSHDDFVDP